MGLFMRGKGWDARCVQHLHTSAGTLLLPAAPLAFAKHLCSEIALDWEVPVHYTSILWFSTLNSSKQPAYGQKSWSERREATRICRYMVLPIVYVHKIIKKNILFLWAFSAKLGSVITHIKRWAVIRSMLKEIIHGCMSWVHHKPCLEHMLKHTINPHESRL